MLPAYKILSSYYDHDWGKFSTQYLTIIRHIENRFRIAPKTILDISCGTGILVNELSKNYTAFGSDISEDMINIARSKYPKLKFFVADMAELKLEDLFDLVLCSYDSMNYLINTNHFQKAVKNIYKLLNPAGHFLFDFNTDQAFIERYNCVIDRDVNGIKFKQLAGFNKESRIAEVIFDFGNNVRECHYQKAYNYNEVEEILTKCKFKVAYSWDMETRSEINENTKRILILARKEL